MNYIITSCFLGTTTELWRFPELFYMLCLHLMKKSSYENPGIRAAALWEFQIGSQYAWMMLVFAVFVVFSLISPLITPLGVIYMIIKYYVDKHNIFFAYAKCKVDNSVHKTAVNFVLFCMFLLLTITFVFTNVAWTDETSGHTLQFWAAKLFVIALVIIVCGLYGDLTGTIGTVIFQAKELLPWRESAKEPGSKYTRKSRRKEKKQGIRDEFDENFFYKTVPRIPIHPQDRYFAPMLRKDFPFALQSKSAPVLTKEFHELLHYAELSLHHKPVFDNLISSITTLKGEGQGPPAGGSRRPTIANQGGRRRKRFHFNPVVKYRESGRRRREATQPDQNPTPSPAPHLSRTNRTLAELAKLIRLDITSHR